MSYVELGTTEETSVFSLMNELKEGPKWKGPVG